MKRFLPWITLGLSIIVLAAVYIYISAAMNKQDASFSRQRPPAQETPLDVSVITVNVSSHAAAIGAVGIAQPHQNLTLTSQVSGEVMTLADQFEVGSQIKQGQALLTLSNISLKSDLASAQNQLANAALALKEEQRQVEQANAEWRAAGLDGDPASDLVLRAPQLASAKADVTAAKAALALAKDNVEKLSIKAPFDSIVVSKDVSLGSYLSSNTQVATLYSTDRVTINIELSLQDWQKLPDAQTLIAERWPATVQSVNGHDTWQGYVKQAGFHVDSASGLRSLFIAVDRPLEQTPALLPGSYVKIALEGAQQQRLWQLPNSSLSQKSQIWYIDQDNRLANFDTTPVFVDQTSVYIEPPAVLQNTPQQVLTHPYNSYLTGMLANPLQRATQ